MLELSPAQQGLSIRNLRPRSKPGNSPDQTARGALNARLRESQLG